MIRTDLFPGAVVLADVKNPRESISTLGKVRPAVLVRRHGPHGWILIGLTSQPYYKTTRQPRVPVWASRRNGLRTNGYLWGSKPTRVPEADVLQRIGIVDEHLAEVISANCAVGELDAVILRTTARRPLSDVA